MEQHPPCACEWTKSNKNKKQKYINKAKHIQTDHKFYSLIYPTSNAMVSLRDDFSVWGQSPKGYFLPIIY